MRRSCAILLCCIPVFCFAQNDSFHRDTSEIIGAYQKAIDHMVYWQLDSALLNAGPALQRIETLITAQQDPSQERLRALRYWHAKLLDIVGRADPEIANVDSLFLAMEILTELDSTLDVALVHTHLSEKYGSQGLHLKAVHHQREAVRIYEEAGMELEAAINRNILGVDYRVWGDPGTALELHLQALPVFETAKDTGQLAYTNVLLGAVHRSTGQYALAIPYCEKARKLYLSKGDEHGASMAMFDMGHYHMRIDQLDSAEFWLKRSITVREKFAYFHGLAYASQYLAYVKERQDSLEQAIPYYLEAADYFGQVPTYGSMAGVYSNLSEVYFKLGRTQDAERSMRKALQIVEEHQENWTAPTLYDSFGRLLLKMGRTEQALEAFLKGREVATKVQSFVARRRLCASLYKFYADQGQYRKAFSYHQEYLQAKDSADTDGDRRRVTQAMLRHDVERLQMKEEAHDELKRLRQAQTLNAQVRQQFVLLAGGGLLLVMAIGLVGRIRFSTRSKRALQRQQMDLRRAKERAEQSEQFKERFLANMSHEVRTPMNAIMGMTTIMQRNEHLPEQQGYLDAIASSSDSLLQIINDILDLSKLNAQRLELEQTEFHLINLLEELKERYVGNAVANGLALHLELKDVPEMVKGDPTRVQQVLGVLLYNAVKFTDEGHVVLRVTALEGDKIEFIVKDTGNGIPADRIDSIFDEFTKAYSEGKRKYGGSGLGLTLGKRLVQLMGGSISVQSEVGQGSEFRVVIPLPTAANSSEYHADEVRMDGLRILLADDNEFNRMVASDELLDALQSPSIMEAQNGKQAVELMAQHPFDLVLMDVQMPEMNGYDATKAIRQLDGDKGNTPILAMTANDMESEVRRCLDAGMDGFVPKPFKREQLMEAMQKALAGRK